MIHFCWKNDEKTCDWFEIENLKNCGAKKKKWNKNLKAIDPDIVDHGQLQYSIFGPIRAEFESGNIDSRRSPFLLNSTTGDILTNILFQPSWKGTFAMKIFVNDSEGHSDTALVSIKLLSFDQQVELIFESPANQIWNEAPEIIRLLSSVTLSNATIDDVQLAKKDPIPGKSQILDQNPQSKVLVHFLNENNEVLPVATALRFEKMTKFTIFTISFILLNFILISNFKFEKKWKMKFKKF